MFSVIYTPTEGDAIANFSRLFRRPEGCFLNIDNIDRVSRDLAQVSLLEFFISLLGRFQASLFLSAPEI